MMSMKHYFSFLFCFSFVPSFVVTAPVGSSDDPLAKFVEFLKGNNCSMPTAVVLPFTGTDSSPFSYLWTPLKECRTPEAVLRKSEPNLLCRETFEVLQNITCYDFGALPKINGSQLSLNVCKDFAAVQNILPKQSDYLSVKLNDSVVCNALCTGRYELLCKTLLWSYDVLATIKKATNSKPKETLTEDKNQIPNESDLNAKTTEENVEENHQEVNEIAEKTKEAPPDMTYSEETKEASPKGPAHDEIPQTVSLPNSSKDGTVNASQNVLPSTQKSVPTPETPDQNVPKEEKSGEAVTQLSSSTPEKVSHSTVEKVDNESKVSNASSVVLNESIAKSSTTSAKSSTSTKSSMTDAKPDENPDLSVVPETEIESGVNNGGLQEPSENETDVKKKMDVVIDSISSTDKMEDLEPHPDVKDPELYNDENDGDYPKQEYADTAFSPSVKKEPEVKTVDEVSGPLSSNSVIRETFLPGRNYVPEPEDSHFFFYFLSIVLILMAGYLIFHNKQKIIALIVEGRHERRRRSHGAGYKKLETK